MLFALKKTCLALPVKALRQECKLAKSRQTIQDAFGKLQQGTDYPYCSGAEWSTHDLIMWCLEQIGPADLTACTWSMAEHAVERLVVLLTSGQLTSVSMLVDWRVKVRTPGALPFARLHFADVRVTTCHAKVFVLRNQRWAVSVVGSANFTNNPRIEAGNLSTSLLVADFHEKWIKAEIANAKPFGEDMNPKQKDGRR